MSCSGHIFERLKVKSKIISADHLPICLKFDRYSIASSSDIFFIKLGLKVLLRVFFAKSSQSDYLVFLLNRGFTFFVSPLLISQIAIATVIFHFLHKIDLLTSGIFSDISKTVVVILFTLFVFILDDLTKYFVHRWMHKWPILWSLHKVHHSATQLTPITIYRTHPLEGIVFSLRAAFTQGVSISLFIYLFASLGGGGLILKIVKPFSSSLISRFSPWIADLISGFVVLFGLWYICYWLYKKAIFIKI